MPRLFLAALCLIGLIASAPRAAAATEVDLELVLAVDVSFSMDLDEQRLQRSGYVEAFRDPDVQRAIASGLVGRIAVSYVEWAGFRQINVVLPWTIVSDRASAEAVARALEAAPISRHRRTSISGGLMTALELLEASPFRAQRRIIDISGDGPNNDGPRLVPVRDDIIARGIVINGLPIVLNRGMGSSWDIPNLDEYYEDCVIGGPGSFSIPIRERHEFLEATRRKILMEVAGLAPEPAPRVLRASTAPRVSCEVGEQMWRRWFDR